MATNYSISLNMSDETVLALEKRNYKLYGFKAVTSDVPGSPVIWFKVDTYGKLTDFQWERQLNAYTSLSSIIPGGRILATNPYQIDLGQTLDVTSTKGLGTVSGDGLPNLIRIRNKTTTEFTCGISESVNENGKQLSPSPICAFPLFGMNSEHLQPIEKVMLMFATSPYDAGTVVEQSFGPALLIDLTKENRRAVGYDINKGWEWGGGTWATAYPVGTNLDELLVAQNPQLSLPRPVPAQDNGFTPQPRLLDRQGMPETKVAVVNGMPG
jgi:hypothetical protein